MNLKVKKILGLLLSVLMILSAVPVCASAAELAGKGTAQEPYLISSADDMKLLASAVNAGDSFFGNYVSLQKDIAFEADDYVPVGTKTAPFSGIFNGNGHTVNVKGITCDYAGIFGAIKNAEIKNLSAAGEFNAASYAGAIAALSESSVFSGCISSAGVYGDTYTGGIAGYVNLGEIKNCSTTAQAAVGGYKDMTGGIAGFSSGNISFCENNAYTFGIDNTGGIAGYSTGTISSCVNVPLIETENNNCGGIAGFSEGKISVCKNTGEVKGKGKTGGILGAGYNAELLTCENSGKVTAGGEFSAGIAAYMTGGSIKRCLFSGSVSSTADYAAGIAGYVKNTEVKECFSSSDVIGKGKTAAALCGINGGDVSSCYYASNGRNAFAGGTASDKVYALGSADLLNPTAYEGWDFTGVWATNSIHSPYPLLNEIGYHKLDDVISSNPPTCTKDGVETYICSVCSETVDKIIPSPGHDFELITFKEATCLENGYKDYKCAVCGETKSETIKAEGHKDEDKNNVCDVCGKELDPDHPELPEGNKNIFQTILDMFSNLFKLIVDLVHEIQDAIANIKK